MSSKPSKNEVAALIDHTLLKADADETAIRQLCVEAVQYRFHSVCVYSSWVPLCVELLRGSGVTVAAVVGFPHGAQLSAVKAFEAREAVQAGALEIDMVQQIGRFKSGDLAFVSNDIHAVVVAVRAENPDAIVKVILEAGFLTDEELTAACRLAEQAGAHYVKTSTGFGPGGATPDNIALMRAAVSRSIGVKASGGVRDYDAAVRVIAAGATRIGTSSGLAILSGADTAGDAGGY